MATTSPAIGQAGKFGDLKRRLWFLLGAIVVYRIGAHIPVPGIEANVLADLFNSQQGGILGMFNMFSGGALSRFTIFALGIMPVVARSRSTRVTARCSLHCSRGLASPLL